MDDEKITSYSIRRDLDFPRFHRSLHRPVVSLTSASALSSSNGSAYNVETDEARQRDSG